AADPGLTAAMVEVRRLVGLGRQARTEARIKVRQPLARALISVPDHLRAGGAGLLDLVAAELNVKEVGFAEGESGLVAYRLAPNFPAPRPRFGGDAPGGGAARGRCGRGGAGGGGGDGGRGAGDRLAGGPRRRHRGRPRPGGHAPAAPGGTGPRPGPGRAGVGEGAG